jgi:CRP-like cAMP-binding protein
MSENKNTLLHEKIISLAPLSAASLDKLLEAACKRQLTKGEIILKPGQVCKKIFFVENGYLRTFIEKDGLDINTDFTFENNFTTNLKSLRSSLPSDTTIQAEEATIIYEYDKYELLELYKLSPEIESFGRNLLEQLLILQEEHINLFKLFTPTERYNYLRTHKPQFIQRVSVLQLSSYLGVARETLSRIRKKR